MGKSVSKVKDSYFQESFDHFVNLFEQQFDFDRLSITLKYQNSLIIFALNTNEEEIKRDCGSTYDLKNSAAQQCIDRNNPLKNDILTDAYSENRHLKDANFKYALHFPLYIHDASVGSLNIISYNENQYGEKDIENAEELLYTLTILLENYNLQTIIRKSENLLSRHPVDLEHLIDMTSGGNGISHAEGYFQELLDKVYDYVFVENSSGKIIQVSPKFVELLNYPSEEIIGQSVLDFCVDKDKEKLRTLNHDGAEISIEMNTKEKGAIQLHIKIFQVNNSKGEQSVKIYQARQIIAAEDVFRRMEDQFGITDLSYHLQYVSPNQKADLDEEQLLGRKCYLVYNRSMEICENCPIEKEIVTTEQLKKHVVFTEFKNRKKIMIFFSLIKLEDDSVALVESFREESFLSLVEDELTPSEISQFIDYGMDKIKSPISAIYSFTNGLRDIPFEELEYEIYLEKLGFIYDTTKHLESVIDSMAQAFKEKMNLFTLLLEQKGISESAILAKKEKTILIVDPNDTKRHTLNNFLSDLGYKTLLAKDGLEGIIQTKKHLPDMILLDIIMPKVNGILFAQKIKEHIRKKIPCFVISDNKDPKIMKMAFKTGVKAYLKKSPLNLKEIGQLIFNIFDEMEKDTKSSQSKASKPKTKLKKKKTTQEIFQKALSKEKMTPTQIEESPPPPPDIPTKPPQTIDTPDTSLQLSDLGFNLEEKKDGTILDFGMSEEIPYTINVDEGIVVANLSGFLTKEKLEPIVKNLIQSINQQPPSQKSLLLNLQDVVEKSITTSVLDFLFSFQSDIDDLQPNHVKLLSFSDEVDTAIHNHPIGKQFTVLRDFITAFSQLQMDI